MKKYAYPVKLYSCATPQSADGALEQAIGAFDEVFIIGLNKSGELEAKASTNLSIEEILCRLEQFKHKIMNGEYEIPPSFVTGSNQC